MKQKGAPTNPFDGNGHFESNGHDYRQRQVTFRDYLRVLYKNRWVIIISFFLVMGATVYFTFSSEPVYEASAKIMVEQQTGVGESLFEITSMMKKETMINNQVEILKSRTLAERVTRALQQSPYADQLRVLGNSPDGKDSSPGIFASIKKLLFENGDGAPPDESSLFDNYAENLRSSINVNPIRNTDMIEIKVSAPSPFEAAFLTNAVAQAYQSGNREQSQQEVRQVKNFLDEQLELYQKELAESEDALKDYQEEARVVALDQETQELVSKIAEFETMYNEAKTDLQANKRRLEYIDTQLAKHNLDIDIETISSQPYLAELKRQIAEKEGELAKYRAQMTEIGDVSSGVKREIQRMEGMIDALKARFGEEVTKIAKTQFVDPAEVSGTLFSSKIEVETALQSLEPKVSALEDIVKKYNAELETLPEKSIRLARLMRKRQVDEKIYIMLQEKYQESRITEVGQLGNVRIIDAAKNPKFPVKPKKKLNLLLGIFVGLGLGVGVAFVLEYLDNTVQTIEDVEALGMTIMATIPYIKPEANNGMLSKIHIDSDPEVEDLSERLVTHLKPRSPISEAYRTLRTNLLFSSPDKHKQTLMVTSSGPKEGKSTTVSNLAITFAQMGNKTLLIDADMRRPVLHKLFGLEKNVGLTNILVGRATLDETAKQMDDLPNLHILNCGVIPPNPAELLGSENMRDLLDYAKSQYNIILIDTPPVIAVTDAAVLASSVDGCLLLIRSGQTVHDAARHAYEQLNKVNASILGAVLNGVQISHVYGSQYYYYHYQYAYGTEEKNGKTKRKKSKVK
ncbi:polysaccharide biosynthesis tyrosine autokinase [candidate division KSB1 bacterium]|nr:polysaccharide biosynthesis tyrosine autokinase [candidate division KSB1 bacterium]